MKRILALFLAICLALPVFAEQTTGDPDTGHEPSPARDLPGEEDLAPKAQFTLAGEHGLDLGTGNLLLVNYDHHVAPEYVPADMVTFSGRRVLKPSMDLRAGTKAAYEAMSAAMDAEGLTLYICSGYRTYEYQTGLFTKRLKSRLNSGMNYAAAWAATNRYTAYPGTSEHETGMAIDLAKDVNAVLNDYFGTTPVGKWLYNNCADYGFILRYTKEKESVTRIGYEPWHFRYVGLPHSRIITEQGWAFEEYLEHLQDGEELTWTDETGAWTVRYTTDHSAIAKMEHVDSYSYDNCGGWVVTCRDPDPGVYTAGHWSRGAFDYLFGDRPYTGGWTIVPDKPIPLAGFRYLYSLLGVDTDPQWGDTDPINRQTAAVVMADLVTEPAGETVPFVDDGAIADWAKASVDKLAYAGILQGTTDGRLNPNGTLTWGEAATLLARLKEYLGK